MLNPDGERDIQLNYVIGNIFWSFYKNPSMKLTKKVKNKSKEIKRGKSKILKIAEKVGRVRLEDHKKVTVRVFEDMSVPINIDYKKKEYTLYSLVHVGIDDLGLILIIKERLKLKSSGIKQLRKRIRRKKFKLPKIVYAVSVIYRKGKPLADPIGINTESGKVFLPDGPTRKNIRDRISSLAREL